MKTAIPKLAVLAVLTLQAVRAQEAPAAQPEKPPVVAAPAPAAPAPARSPNLIPGLPHYAPPAPEPRQLDQPKPLDANTDPDVLVLPKMTVKQKPRPRLSPEVVYDKQAFGDILAKQKFTQLDQVLNKFTLPLFGRSIAERALEEHEREKKKEMNDSVNNLAKVLEAGGDAAEAKALRDAAAKP
jgi:hypothetical protein